MDVIMWENIDEARKDSAHYAVMRLQHPGSGMDALKEMFPDAAANRMNFVLFSTSGVHGTYSTIEENERTLQGELTGDDAVAEVTFLIIHPRLASVRYGVCAPKSLQDINFLKQLRKSSHKVIRTIGIDD